MEIEESLLVVGLCPTSAIIQEPNENPHCLSGKFERGTPKVYQSVLRLLWGTGDFKGKFLSQCASDIRIKLQQLQQQDPAASLDEMVQTATNTFYNREQEREAQAKEREKRKEKKHAQMLVTLQGSAMANPESLKDKAWGKCLIYGEAGQWAKEYPNHDKSVKTAWYKCHHLRHRAALCPGDPKPQGQALGFPSQWSTGLKSPTPASQPVTDNHHGTRAKTAIGCGR